MDNRFSNIFNLTEDQAIALLKKPLNTEDGTSERYVGAAHLINFPTERSINALIEAIEDRDPALENRIARRKALESLGRLKAVRALPTLRACLSDEDVLTVENAVWSIGEIGTEDESILEEIANLLGKPNQTYRVIIHTLANFDYKPAIDRIKPFTNYDEESVVSAAISSLARLTEDNSQMGRVVEFLQNDNINARRACIQDLIDVEYYPAISAIAKAPISIAFRLRGIRLLAAKGIGKGKITFGDIESSLDRIIRDRPQDIEMVHEYDQLPSLEFLIRELYHTDFGRCYLAGKTILETYPAQAPEALLKTYAEEAHNDYGAHFHVVKLLGLLKHKSSYDLIVEALHNDSPQFQKSRAAAAIALGNIHEIRAIPILKETLNTPIFDLKYASLLALEQLGESCWSEVANDQNLLIKAKANYKLS
ncbi:HEAT repeat domain-containing protein [Waterburya agarophytonicola K14]|uniref:HEAT repeat domain-containing protein n=1 Tax=Waterburya agarophytonicola KI4 TaxID=2874699 RepID=A0A964FFH4_9CYAN|nr:HEAT repeat domain-containing protein [Waterburya agarophytonicola]MCC0176967.1 HEAT repeat domain-containing protein [Waterburya agarophytonicola KI4]